MADHVLRKLLEAVGLGRSAALVEALEAGRGEDEAVFNADFQALAEAARGRPPLTAFEPAVARPAVAAALKAVAGPLEPGVVVEPLSIEGPGGAIALRAYRPDNQDAAAPLLVFAHMGGGVIGDLDSCEAFCSVLAGVGRCPVLSVDYRLAPEHRFPAGLEDVLAAYRWARGHAARFGAPAGKAAVGGESMGANFAAVVAQEMKRTGEPQPALQLLVYPLTEIDSQTQSMTTQADAYPTPRATLEWMMGHYLPPGADPADPRLSPLHAEDISGLAPAIVVTAGFDPLADQGEAYAKRLSDAHVPVIYRCYRSLPHAFAAYTGAVPAAAIACREIAGLFREGLEGRIR